MNIISFEGSPEWVPELAVVCCAYQEYLRGKKVYSSSKLKFPNTYLDFTERFSEFPVIDDSSVVLLTNSQVVDARSCITRLNKNFYKLDNNLDIYISVSHLDNIDPKLRSLVNIRAECKYRDLTDVVDVRFKDRRLRKDYTIVNLLGKPLYVKEYSWMLEANNG